MHFRMKVNTLRRRLGAVACGCLAALSCGSPAAPSSDNPTISIGSAGVAPTEVRIRAWSHVTFVNSDNRPHNILSDPVDLHTDCPSINVVGLLNPGESRSTGALYLAQTCGFHDHNNPADAPLKGRIVVY
jgi:plastocyanin